MGSTENETDLIWQKLKSDSIRCERSMDKLYRKQTGCYFTALDLAYAMMKELVASFSAFEQQRLFEKTFFEPCVGTGNFVFAYLRLCREKQFSPAQNRELFDHIFACDINEAALKVYRENLTLVAREWFGVTLTAEYFAAHIGSGLVFNVDSSDVRYIPLEKIFDSSIVKNGFDIVVTNPPYKNLKAEHTHYQSEDQKARDRQKYIAIGKLASKHFLYAASGTLNLYKLFVEEIIERYLSTEGTCALLVPSSVLSDKSCAKLRTRMLEHTAIQSLRLISENSSYVAASQALCAMLLRKGGHTTGIRIDGSFTGDIGQGAYAPIADIIDEASGNAMLVLSGNAYRIRGLMRKHPTIKKLPYIHNLRGELDVTTNREAIVRMETPYRLLRGRHIRYYATIELPEKEYVAEPFVKSTAKRHYLMGDRLACQQIANMAKKRRIAFTLVPKNCVLANSCNFICVDENPDGIDLFFLMGILNSDLMDWYFRLTSSNNHINNYEIDNFPIPVSYPRKEEISRLVRQYLLDADEALLIKINSLVNEAYGVSETQEPAQAANHAIGESAPKSVFEDPQTVISALWGA